jgi:alginate O-acetyltransferase complex protein AlgI
MLFNSFPFLLVFLPIALLAHWAVKLLWPLWRLPLLVILSLIFYGYWDWRFVPLLSVSILFNWLTAEFFWDSGKKTAVAIAIISNLLILFMFKYFNFFSGTANLLPVVTIPKIELILPLGISFFTFHHIMYLTDLKAGKAPRLDLVRYALYITFFPQMLAGPLVRWSEIIQQFEISPSAQAMAKERFARGLMLLIVGLAKKVLLGDPLAEIVNPIFLSASQGKQIAMDEAWQAMLGFTFQIYFDFSGYTDMALGLALLFGIKLPENFDVPYRAVSLQEFWRRWHITLSRFLRDYLYIAFGGNRRGLAVQLFALLATMTLGGLWHGAGYNFLIWGCAHGLGLCVGLLWQRAGLKIPILVSWLLTFFFVALMWIPFRAPDIQAAWAIYEGLFHAGSVRSSLFPWQLIAIAAAVAIIGPTAWTLVHKLPPWHSVAIVFGVVLVAILFKIGSDVNYEFIYFQF